ncbi:MAG TPA: hypothetical protein VGO50_20350 [Pyrinomonadaceae bacterium]|jgi:hypothetical protein|nr:hypothetical protein [Pyrinomonadaceae bacterium]
MNNPLHRLFSPTGRKNTAAASFLLALFLFFQALQPASAQRPIVITADQPNVWTLEQAHYLLAQMHRRNLDLRAADLGNLDPNAINGTRVDALRTLLDISAEFDESVAVKNRELKDQKTYNTSRRAELIADREKLEGQLNGVMMQISEAKIKRGRTDDEDEQKKLDAEIKELEVLRDFINQQIENKNKELATLGATGDYATVTPPAGSGTNKQSSAFDSALVEAVKEVTKQFSGSPQLNASLRLDNYLQMQYEILSKQLTLLRDEVGAGERLIFLEMPQSINTSYDKADNKWAQSWWKIAAYSQCIAYQDEKITFPCSKIYDKDDYSSFYRNNRFSTAEVISQIGKTADTLGAYEGRLLLNREDLSSDRLDDLAAIDKAWSEHAGGIPAGLKGAVYTSLKEKVGEYRTAKEAYQKATSPEAKKEIEVNEKNVREGEVIISELGRVYSEKETELSACQEKYKNIKSARIRQSRCEVQETARNKAFYFLQQKQGEVNQGRIAAQNMKSDMGIKRRAFDSKETELTDALFETLSKYIENGNTNFDAAVGKMGSRRISLFRRNSITDKRLFRRIVVSEEFNTGVPISNAQETKIIGVKDFPGTLETAATNKNPLARSAKDDPDYYQTKIAAEIEKNAKTYNQRSIRIIDMFPKQSSLNVNELKMESNALSMRFLFKILTGFAANTNYERNRERYSQFVQQELYSSAFGKGSTEFGWTFNPMPGTKRVLSGTKTTFAIMVVPEDATAIVLQSRGAYFSRSSVQPTEMFDNSWIQDHVGGDKRGWTSDEAKTFVVPIPDGGSMNNNEFFVNGVTYNNVDKGKRITLSVFGRNFSSQIGILVNGVPLTPSLGLGQPFIRDDSKAAQNAKGDLPKGEVEGSFERVDSEQIIASFKMDEKFEGTPTIALIAPGKGLVLNTLGKGYLYINGDINTTLDASQMFGKKPEDAKTAVKLEKVEVFKDKVCTVTAAPPVAAGKAKNKVGAETNVCVDKLNVLVTGTNLDQSSYIYINSQVPDKMAMDSFTALARQIPPPAEKKVQVTVVSKDGALSLSVDNPFFKDKEEAKQYEVDTTFDIGKPEFLGYKQNLGAPVTYAVFRMTVKKFSEKVRASLGALVAYKKLSDTEAEVMVTVDSSLLPGMIELIDDKAEKKNSVVLTIPPEDPRARQRRDSGRADDPILAVPLVKPLDRGPNYLKP